PNLPLEMVYRVVNSFLKTSMLVAGIIKKYAQRRVFRQKEIHVPKVLRIDWVIPKFVGAWWHRNIWQLRGSNNNLDVHRRLKACINNLVNEIGWNRGGRGRFRIRWPTEGMSCPMLESTFAKPGDSRPSDTGPGLSNDMVTGEPRSQKAILHQPTLTISLKIDSEMQGKETRTEGVARATAVEGLQANSRINTEWIDIERL
ncbi:hypothetical protein BY996DRAFT_6443530, partial [Phakopsora pachyrhizi]